MEITYEFMDQLEDAILLVHLPNKMIHYTNQVAREFLAQLFYDEAWVKQLADPKPNIPLEELSPQLTKLPQGLAELKIRNLSFWIFTKQVTIKDKIYLLVVFKDQITTSLELTNLIKALYNSTVITTEEAVIEKSLTDPSVSPTNPIGLNLKELEDSGYLHDSISLKIAKEKTFVKTHVTYPSGKVLSWRGKPFYDEEGKFHHIVSVGKDITKIVNLNARLQKERLLEKSYKEQIQFIKQAFQSEGIIYSSDAMKQIIDTILKVAPTDSPVILTGESGVGKDLMAAIIHGASPRRNGPFIPINCSAIPESLMETELFGYEKGAFTGADPKGKKGYFESAQGGTIFLDEIGELPLSLQSKLLRVLQEKVIMRTGGSKPIPVDVRILSATNLSAENLYDWKGFRQDLYYRLSVIHIEIPPLRERREDIFPLADHFLHRYNQQYGKNLSFSHDAIKRMYHHPWMGNVRELKNTMEIEVLLAEDEKVTMGTLAGLSSSTLPSKGEKAVRVGELMSMKEAYAKLENLMIKKAVEETGSITGAAKKLSIAASTIHRKLNKQIIDL